MNIADISKSPRSIAVDEEVFRELQRQAEPLIDDANSVLRRVLGIESEGHVSMRQTSVAAASAEQAANGQTTVNRQAGKPRVEKRASTKGKRKRAPKGSLLPEADYELPLLQALSELGGSGPASTVVDRVGEKLSEKLTSIDREPVSSGEVRWKNRVQFVRLGLIKGGHMKDDSPRGIWEISDAGHARLAETTGDRP